MIWSMETVVWFVEAKDSEVDNAGLEHREEPQYSRGLTGYM